MADDRRKSGLSGVSAVLGLFSRRTSEPAPAEAVPSAHLAHDAMERMERPVRDVARTLLETGLLEDLQERERMHLAEIAHIARCHGGAQVWAAGDPAHHVLILVQGRMEARAQLMPGVDHVVRAHQPGDVVGLEAAFGAPSYHLACFATERTAVIRLPADALRKMFELGRPAAVKLQVKLAQMLGDQLRAATLEVVRLLEKSSAMPARGEGIGEAALSELLKKP